jgi:hypothetical protein
MKSNKYVIPKGKKVEISDALLTEIEQRFAADRENRFQLFLLSSGIRKRYLNKDGNYRKQFIEWFQNTNAVTVYGSLSNFTKYASCGDVVNFIGTKTSNPDKYIEQLPVSVGALYEISIILKSDKDLFKVCLHFTASRKSIDAPQHEWKTIKPALIRRNITELAVRTWRRKWENPPPPKQKRTDKRTLPFVEIKCNGELFDFNKKTGEKTGVIDLHEVEDFFTKLTAFFQSECPESIQFKLVDHMDYLTEGYYQRRESVDPAKNVALPAKKQRYK